MEVVLIPPQEDLITSAAGRFKDLLGEGVPGENILVLAPRSTMSNGIKERVLRLFSRGYSELWCDTGTSFCRKLLNRFPLGLKRGLVTVRDWKQYVLFDEATRNITLKSEFRVVQGKRPFILRAMSIAKMLEANAIAAADFADWANKTSNPKFMDLSAMYTAYRDFCDKTGVFSLPGLACLIHDRLETSPNLAKILAGKFRNIILAGAQDMDVVYLKTAQLLSAYGTSFTAYLSIVDCLISPAGDGVWNPLDHFAIDGSYAVKQLITCRADVPGAVSRFFAEVTTTKLDFVDTGKKQLEQSGLYLSEKVSKKAAAVPDEHAGRQKDTSELALKNFCFAEHNTTSKVVKVDKILQGTSDQVSDGDFEKHPLSDKTLQKMPTEAKGGKQAAAGIDASNDMLSPGTDYPAVVLVQADKAFNEVVWVVEKLKELVSSGVSPDECTVFYRDSQYCQNLLEVLRKSGIPWYTDAESHLYYDANVKFIIDVLIYIIKPSNSERLFQVLAAPAVGLDPYILRRWLREAKEMQAETPQYILQMLQDMTDDGQALVKSQSEEKPVSVLFNSLTDTGQARVKRQKTEELINELNDVGQMGENRPTKKPTSEPSKELVAVQLEADSLSEEAANFEPSHGLSKDLLGDISNEQPTWQEKVKTVLNYPARFTTIGAKEAIETICKDFNLFAAGFQYKTATPDEDKLNLPEDNNPTAQLNRLLVVLEAVRFTDSMRKQSGEILSISDFLQIWSEAGFRITHNRQGSAEGVAVVDIRQAESMEKSYVFIPGAVDGILPLPRRTQHYLTEAEVKTLFTGLSPLKPEGAWTKEQFFLQEAGFFIKAMQAGKKNVFISFAPEYPGLPDAAPSVFVHRLLHYRNVCRENTVLCGLGWEVPVVKEERGIDLPLLHFGQSTMLSVLGCRCLHNSAQDESEMKSLLNVLPEKAYKPVYFLPLSREPVMFKGQVSISASGIKEFLNCPRQFFISRMLRIEEQAGDNLQFYSIVHKVLDMFHEMYPNLADATDPELAMEQVLADLSTQYFYSYLLVGEAWRRKAGEILLAYLNNEKQRWEPGRKVAYRNYEFKFRCSDISVRGVIDRIDLLPVGTVELIDYKTGNAESYNSIKKKFLPPAEGEYMPGDFSLPIYYWSVKEHMPGVKIDRLTYYYLKQVDKMRSFRLLDECAGGEELCFAFLDGPVKDKFYEIITLLKQGDFPAVPVSCHYCNYSRLCGIAEEGEVDAGES